MAIWKERGMNLFSIINYIAACSLANIIATINLGSSIILVIGAVFWFIQKPRFPKVVVLAMVLILVATACSCFAFKTVVSSFVDVKSMGFWTFSGPVVVCFEIVRTFITSILGEFGEMGLLMTACFICGKKVILGIKVFIFSILANFLVVYFLNGKIFVVLGAIFRGS
jgi:hypothetical protein